MQVQTRSNTTRHQARLMFATLTLAVAGALSLPAVAAPHDHAQGARAGASGKPAMHAMHGAHGMGGYGMAMMNPRMAERWLDAVNASPEQRSQIQQIMQASRADRQAQAEAGRSLHEQSQALFAQPTVDARQAEALRQQMLAQHDKNSQRQMQAMLEISRVLTPEQRQQMAEQMAQRKGMMQRHRAERQSMEPRTPVPSR